MNVLHGGCVRPAGGGPGRLHLCIEGDGVPAAGLPGAVCALQPVAATRRAVLWATRQVGALLLPPLQLLLLPLAAVVGFMLMITLDPTSLAMLARLDCFTSFHLCCAHCW